MRAKLEWQSETEAISPSEVFACLDERPRPWIGRRCQRSFSELNPISARTIAMIQNRITIWLSVQPRCSKWW